MDESEEIKCSTVSNKIAQLSGRMRYDPATINTALKKICVDGHLIRESVNCRTEVVYITPWQKAKIEKEKINNVR